MRIVIAWCETTERGNPLWSYEVFNARHDSPSSVTIESACRCGLLGEEITRHRTTTDVKTEIAAYLHIPASSVIILTDPISK